MNQANIYREPEEPKAPEIEIYYKTAVNMGKRPKITHSNDVYNTMYGIGEMNRNLQYKEMFYALYLNQANEVLAVHKISEGTTTAAPVDVKFIMQGAIMTNATQLAICHNHPSGSTSPSRNDKRITEKIKQAAALFDVELIDSVIITTTNYYSFTAEGIL